MTGVLAKTFAPCMEVLPPAQKRLWPYLRATIGLGFTLYGGTAIALRLGHRTSVDFDFFSPRPLDREAMQSALPFMAQSVVLQDQPNNLTVLVPASDIDGDSEPAHVKLSFFGTIGFGRVAKPDRTEDGVLQVASLDDLMATKVKVILQRAEAKDYRDIAAMVNAAVSLPRGLAAAREMFGPNFQPGESLKAMVYFEDGDLRTLTIEEKRSLVTAASQVRDLPGIELIDRPIDRH